MKKFVVQISTHCDGWIDTWHYVEEAEKDEPGTFESYAAAEAALNAFLAKIDQAIIDGQREPDSGYSRDEFRIAEIRQRKKGA